MRVVDLLLIPAFALATGCASGSATLENANITSNVRRLMVRVAQHRGATPSSATAPTRPPLREPGGDATRNPRVETGPALAYDRVDDWDDFWEEVYEAEIARPDVEDDAAASEAAMAPDAEEGDAAVEPVAGVEVSGDAVNQPAEGDGTGGADGVAAAPPAEDAVASRRTEAEAAGRDEDALVAEMNDLRAQTAALEQQIASTQAQRVRDETRRRRRDALIMNNAALSLYTALMIRRMQLAQLSRLIAARRGVRPVAPSAPAFGGVPQGAPAQQPFNPPPTPGPGPFE
ncbi:MAG: hypothetical protein RIF41_24635 [Polyangiaceae bacterium]